MKKLSISLIINGLSLYLISYLFDGIVIEISALIALTLIFCVLNTIVNPILKLFALPLTIMTLGLFTLVINGIVLNLAFSLVNGAYCDSLITCIGASIVLSVLNTGLEAIFNDEN